VDESVTTFLRRLHVVELALNLGDGHERLGLGFQNDFGS
jgi:hypothetical protein